MEHCSKIIIYTDSMNTVNIFNTLQCQPEFNPLLRHCIDIMINKDFHIQVLHVPGEQNAVADAISRGEFDRAHYLVPALRITTFQPPQLYTLGAAKK
jgi:Reverse transcriptase-like